VTEFVDELKKQAKTLRTLQQESNEIFNRREGINSLIDTEFVEVDVAVDLHNKTIDWLNASWGEKLCRESEQHKKDYRELYEILKSNDVAKTLFEKLQEINAKNDANFAIAESRRIELDGLKRKAKLILPELDLEDKWHVNPIMNRVRKIVEELLGGTK
jgi:hypothetical protein